MPSSIPFCAFIVSTVLLLLNSANATEIRYSSTTALDPTQQAWLSSEITQTGSDGNGDGLLDPSENVGPITGSGEESYWQVRDQNTSTSLDLPHYRTALDKDSLQSLFENGWTFEVNAKAVDRSADLQISAFTGWGFTADQDPGWGIQSSSVRIGFFLGFNDEGAFTVTPQDNPLIALAPGSADSFHTVKAVGQPYSTQFELFIDEESHGHFEFGTRAVGGISENNVVFGANSKGRTGATTNWKSVELKSNQTQDLPEAVANLQYLIYPDDNAYIANGINTATGAFEQTIDLLSVSGIIDLGFSISYDSRMAFYPGEVGYGWSHNYQMRLVFDADENPTLRWDAHRQSRFAREFNGEINTYTPIDYDLRHAKLVPISGGFELTFSDLSQLVFANDGRLLKILNAAGQELTFEHDNAGRVSRILEPVANVGINLDYNEQGLISLVSDDLGREISLSYDDRLRLITVPAPVLATELTIGEDFTAKPIPDDSSALEIEVGAIDYEGTVGKVILEEFQIQHSRFSDLTIELHAPDGAIYTFPEDPESPAVKDYSGQTIPTYFEGSPRRGTWKLVVKDTVSGESGQVDSIKIKLCESGRALHLAHDDGDFPQAARIIEATDAIGDRVYAAQYDSLGRIVSQDDGRDETPPATVTYSNHPGSFTHDAIYSSSLGFETSFFMDENRKAIRIRNPLGHEVKYEYDGSRNLTKRIDPLGHEILMEYDELDRIVKYTDEGGFETQFAYKDDTRVISSVTNAIGQLSTFEYDGGSLTVAPYFTVEYHDDKQLKSVVRDQYSKVQYYLDPKGRIGTVGYPEAEDAPEDEDGIETDFDFAGRIIVQKDYEDEVTNIRYTGSSEVSRITDPAGNFQIFDYDHRGRLVREIDKRGFSTVSEYDGNGNLVSATNAIGAKVHYEYDHDDRLVATTDPLGRRKEFSYDDAGRLVKTTDAIGRSNLIEYDANNNVVARYTEDGRLDIRLEYDARGLLTSATDSYGNRASAKYNAIGQKTEVTNAKGESKQYEYGKRGQLQFATDEEKRRIFTNSNSRGLTFVVEISGYDYDVEEIPPIEEIEGEGLKQIFRYDFANNLVAQDGSDKDGQVLYNYNRNGLLTRASIHNLVSLEFAYDSVGRMEYSLPYRPSAQAPTEDKDRFYRYDKAGNLTVVESSDLNANDYSISTQRLYDDIGRLTAYINEDGRQISYTYDLANNLTRIRYPDGKEVDYTYDTLNRLATVTDWANRVTTYTWNEQDLIERIELPNGSTRSMVYNRLGQLVERRDLDANNQLITSCYYQYDSNGKIEAEVSFPQDPPPLSTDVANAFDLDWNRLIWTTEGQAEANAAGTILREPLAGQIEYNQRGRMYQTDNYEYQYDEEDNLTGWASRSNPARRTQFEINPSNGLSQIISKTETDGATTSTTTYVYGLGLLYEEVDGVPRYYHHDIRGSLVAMSDSSSSVIGRAAYDPYGKISYMEGDTDTPFLYTGLYGCVTTPDDLVYMRYRFYSPTLRQFTSRDAYVGNIADPASLHYFAYAGNDPISRIDPEGELWWIAVGAAVGATVGAGSVFVEDLLDDGEINTEAERYGAAALGGAVAGAIISGTGGVGIAFVGGAAGAATENLAYAAFTGNKVDGEQLAIDSAIGGATGALGYGAGRVAGRTASKAGSRFHSKYGSKYAANSLKGRFVAAFRPASVTKRFAIRGTQGLVSAARRKAVKNIALRIFKGIGSKVLFSQVDVSLFNQQSMIGPVGGNTEGGSKGLGTASVLLKHYRGGDPQKDEARGMYYNFSLYLQALNIAGQPPIQSPNYNLFRF